MSFRNVMIFVAVALLGLAGFSLWLFWVQNSSQTIVLSFEFWGLGRFVSQDPVPVPVLMASCIGGGFAFGLATMLYATWGQGRRIRELESQVAMSGSETEWR